MTSVINYSMKHDHFDFENIRDQNRIKKSVKFDSSLYLDDIFKRAIKYASSQGEKNDLLSNKNIELCVGIDLITYGNSFSKMAYYVKQIDNKESIELVENHIGNLKLMPNYDEKDIEFIEDFQEMINTTFQCFGKRWYELSEYDVKNSKQRNFTVFEVDQHPFIYFDETRTYSTEKILIKYIQSILKCLCTDILEAKNKLKKVCIAIPSDFHSYQKLILKKCIDKIGIRDYVITNKSTALAMPFFARNLNDSSKKLIIDFGSGYMNCSILQLCDGKNLKVRDHLADRDISSRKFFDQCFRVVKKITRSKKDKVNLSQIKNALYQVMNNNKSLKTSRNNKIQEVWTIPFDDTIIELNMKELGAELLAESIIEKFKNTYLISRDDSIMINEEIKDILICSDTILFAYLEPLLYKYCYETTQITFMDLDCASVGGSYLATTNISTSDMLAFPIGIEIYNGVVKHIINAKKNFPCSGKHKIRTFLDNQKTFRINILEGFSSLARYCKHICEITIENPNYQQTRNKIELIVEFDSNGLLRAYAQDFESKKMLELSIDFDPNFYIKLERDPNEKPIDLSRKLESRLSVEEKRLSKFLDDFDYYIDYIWKAYENSSDAIKQIINEKIVSTKKQISKKRLCITLEECDRLVRAIEQTIKSNEQPENGLNGFKTIQSNYDSGICNLI